MRPASIVSSQTSATAEAEKGNKIRIAKTLI